MGEGPGEGPAGDQAAERADFERFWAVYPRRARRQTTWEWWLRTRSSRPPLAVLLERIQALMASVEWTVEGGKYRPGSDRFLAEGRWDDSFTPLEPAPASWPAGADPSIDVSGQLARLAAALPSDLPGRADLVDRILACGQAGDFNAVESRLAALDRELDVALERDLSPEQIDQLAQGVARAEARLKHLPTGERSDALVRMRRHWVRRTLGAPLLSLFAREAAA